MLIFTKNDGSEIKVDLPLELLIESGRYDEANSQIVLVLANGNSINIPVSDLLDDFYGKSTVDEMLEERDEKIADLETENKSQSEKIERLEKENEEQQKQIESLEADYNPNTLSGEIITITDGLPKSKISSIVNGNSYQETTEGYQLFDLSTITKNNYAASSNGALVPSNYSHVSDYIKVEANEPYTIKVDYSGALSNTQNRVIVYYDNDKNYLSGKAEVNMVDKKTNITPTQDGYIRFAYDVNCFDIMFYKGTDDKPYEPYTGGQASPNTEYKQDVEVVTECSLVQRGKNIFDINDIQEINPNYKKNDDDSLSLSCDNLNGTAVKYFNYYTKKTNRLKPNTEYYIVTEILEVSGTGTLSVVSKLNNTSQITETFSYRLFDLKKGDIKILKITTTSDFSACYTMLRTFCSFSNGQSGSIKFRISVVDKEIDTSNFIYEKYIEPIVHEIDLQGNELAKDDNVEISVNGEVKANKNIGKYIFTGNESFNLMASQKNRIFQYLGLNSIIKRPKTSDELMLSYSNYFRGDYTANYVWGNDIQGIGINSSGNFNIGLGLDSEITTVDELKAWLKEKYENGEAMYMLYPKAETEVINLPSIEPIELIEGITNIFELVTNLGTTLAVTYKVSNKSRLEALENAILSLGGISNV